MQYDITFIHTASIHIQTFDEIMAELAPLLMINHVVDVSLLVHAQQFGMDEILSANLTQQLEALTLQSKVIVITCSSIGALAEDIGSLNGCVIQRVDRAMADYAVKQGGNILVLAALESTLNPTQDLLETSMLDMDHSVNLTFKCIEHAWQYFQNGDLTQYFACIERSLKLNENQFDLIVLAQASMAGVMGQISLNIPVLSSPKLGVQRAIEAL